VIGSIARADGCAPSTAKLGTVADAAVLAVRALRRPWLAPELRAIPSAPIGRASAFAHQQSQFWHR
jgi:hypothetical protein